MSHKLDCLYSVHAYIIITMVKFDRANVLLTKAIQSGVSFRKVESLFSLNIYYYYRNKKKIIA